MLDLFMDRTTQRQILTQRFEALLASVPFTPGNGQEENYPENREL